MKHIHTYEEFLNESENQFTLVLVGGFAIGNYPSLAAAKKAFMQEKDPGLYQIIDHKTGVAEWEQNKK